MRIITQAIRVIDYENNKVLPRDIMPKFGEYIEQLISYIMRRRRIRMRMNKNAIMLKQKNQLPVKYANMLNCPAVFQKVRMKRGQNR